MLNFKKSVLAVAALAMVCSFSACKKNGGDTDKAGAPTAVADGSWNKAELNGLLKYVPADASVAIASTRNFDASSPELSALIAKSEALVARSIKMLDAKIAESTDETEKAQLTAAKAQVEQYKDLKDFTKFGLDAKGHSDSVIFVQGTSIRGFVSITDKDKFKAFVDSLVAGMKASDKDVEITEKAVGEWVLYSSSQIKGEEGQVQPAFGLHIGKDLAAFVVTDVTADEAALNAVLNPAASPISKDAFGKISDDMASVGFADNAKLIDLAKDPTVAVFLAKAFDAPVAPECIEESKLLTVGFPRTNLVQRILKDGRVTVDSTVVMTDKADLAKVSALTAASPDVASKASLFGLKLNLNIDKTIDFMTEVGGKLSAKGFKCGALKSLSDSVNQVPALVQPEVRGIVSGISGLNVAVNSFDLETKKVDAIVDVTGPKIGDTVPMLMVMLQAIDSSIMSAFNLTKDEVVPFDLSPFVNYPLSLNVTYTDNDLVVATAPTDVMAITKLAKTDRKNFVELQFNTALTKSIDKSVDLGESTYTYTIGVNDEGVTSSFIIDL